MKKKKSLMEDKRNNEAQRPTPFGSLEPQKAHLTGEFFLLWHKNDALFGV